MKKAVIIISIIIVISNLPLWDFFLQENYSYSNLDHSFTYNEESGKGKSFIGCVKMYGHFLCEHPEKDQGDNKLYRTFTIQPWKFWEWRQYIFHSDRFSLPYLEPK